MFDSRKSFFKQLGFEESPYLLAGEYHIKIDEVDVSFLCWMKDDVTFVQDLDTKEVQAYSGRHVLRLNGDEWVPVK